MKTAFIFAGQGAQSVGMGKNMYDRSSASKKIFAEADEVLGWSVTEVCFNGPENKLTESKFCQPAIFTVSMACLAGFLEFTDGKIQPCAAAGLSLGEYAAFTCSGFFHFADALKLVAKRGELMDACCRKTDGGMASVLGLAPDFIIDVCKDFDIDAANFNCPGQIVISGPREAVLKASAVLKEKGARRVVPLNVAGAFHSRLMREACEGLAPVLDSMETSDMKIPVAQNFSGKLESEPAQIKKNLKNQVAGSVRWDSCVHSLITDCGAENFLEFGPGTVLTGLLRKIDPSKPCRGISSMDDIEAFAAELK